MTQFRTYEEDWDHREDISTMCAICGSYINKEKLREARRKKLIKPVNTWLPFTIFLRSILDNER